MPYLNWKDRPQEGPSGVRQEIELVGSAGSGAIQGAYHDDSRQRMRLSLGEAAAKELKGALEGIFGEEGGELRLDLPREWIVFWKKREGESRLLLAHPQPEEWVATVALSQEDGSSFMGAMGSGLSESGQTLDLGTAVRVDRVTNLELVLVRH